MTTTDAPFRFVQEAQVSILYLQPELNKVQWGEIDAIGTQVLNALETQHQPNIIVNLSSLNYMGSAMVALIVRIWKATVAKKGKLSVVCPHAGVREVFRLASLDNRFAIVETESEARQKLGVGSTQIHTVGAGPAAGSQKLAVWGTVLVVVILVVGVGVLAMNPGMLGRSPVANSESDPEQDAAAGDDGEAAAPSTGENSADSIADFVAPEQSETPVQPRTTSPPAAAVKDPALSAAATPPAVTPPADTPAETTPAAAPPKSESAKPDSEPVPPAEKTSINPPAADTPIQPEAAAPAGAAAEKAIEKDSSKPNPAPTPSSEEKPPSKTPEAPPAPPSESET